MDDLELLRVSVEVKSELEGFEMFEEVEIVSAYLLLQLL